MNEQLKTGDKVVLDYIKERFDKHEAKFDEYVKEDRKWKEDHANEDRASFAILNKANDKAITLAGVKKVNWGHRVAYLNLIILIGTALVMFFHK